MCVYLENFNSKRFFDFVLSLYDLNPLFFDRNTFLVSGWGSNPRYLKVPLRPLLLPLSQPSTLQVVLIKNWAKPGLFFVNFRPFLNTMTNTINGISVDYGLGIQTRDRRMVGTVKSTELWCPRQVFFFF